MSASRVLPASILCFLLCFGLVSHEFCQATDVRRGLEAWDLLGATDTAATGAMLLDDTADVYIAYSYPHPGSKDFLMTMHLNNPVTIAGFEFRRIHRPKEPKPGIGLLPPQ